MMRRSKIKVRPAINRVKPSKGNATQLLESSSPDVLSTIAPESNKTSVELHRSPHEMPEMKVQNLEMLPNVQKVAEMTDGAEAALKKDDCKTSGAKRPIVRRRKLVACPTMAKKKQKSAIPLLDSKKSTEAKSDTKFVKKLPAFETILEPTKSAYSISNAEATHPSTGNMSSRKVSDEAASEESSKHLTSLTTVTIFPLCDELETTKSSVEQAALSEFPGDDLAVSSCSLDADSELNIGSLVQIGAVATVGIDDLIVSNEGAVSAPLFTPGLDDEESQLYSDVSASDHGVLHAAGKEVAAADSAAIKGVGKSLATKAPSRPKFSVVCKHRNRAVAKLKKLKKEQEGDKKWPDFDQNIVSMSDLIFLNPPNKVGLKLGMNKAQESIGAKTNLNPEPEKIQREAPAVEQPEDAPLPVPQIRIADDGSVVVDEESLVLDTQKPPDPKVRIVYEFGRESVVNQCSFLRQPHPRTRRWSQQETDKFYHCLRIVGAEFSLMGAMFRARTSDDLRRKFRRERKTNPLRVDEALMQQHLSKWTDDMFEADDRSLASDDALKSPKPPEGTVT